LPPLYCFARYHPIAPQNHPLEAIPPTLRTTEIDQESMEKAGGN